MVDRHLKMVQNILQKYPYDFYAFGSRVHGTAKKLSDFDICIMQKVPILIIAQIKEDFTESNLPFIVDITSWEKCSKTFQNYIKKDLQIIPKE